MTDLAFILLTVAFFAAVALVARRASASHDSARPSGRRK
ncbi:hypothetical protein FHX71_000065 [Promicromonospora sukumoe]|jgi:hypothetical protein|uniref:Uncharacterized protein n=1 Tax=Promicromonospora sukumoe TaxID=88382 RepID=A0A7W3J4K1_9MICO|nr:hypothetical protein [Promicromonospora sukumoe]